MNSGRLLALTDSDTSAIATKVAAQVGTAAATATTAPGKGSKYTLRRNQHKRKRKREAAAAAATSATTLVQATAARLENVCTRIEKRANPGDVHAGMLLQHARAKVQRLKRQCKEARRRHAAGLPCDELTRDQPARTRGGKIRHGHFRRERQVSARNEQRREQRRIQIADRRRQR